MGKLLLFSGTDATAIELAAKKAFAAVAGETPDEFASEVLNEDNDHNAENVLIRLLESLETPSFLGGEKSIFLRNFSAFGDEPAKNVKQPKSTGKLLRRLTKYILEEFPPDVNLVMSGTGVNSRQAFAKACSKVGSVEFFKKPDVNDWKWREDVMRLLRNRADTIGMRLPHAAFEYLVEVIGTDTAKIVMEFEKITCYAGDSPTLEQVREVCKGSREAHFFAFTKSLGERNIAATMEALTQTMMNSKDAAGECIRLIRMSANHFRKLLDAVVAMKVFGCRTSGDLQKKVASASDDVRAQLNGNALMTASKWQIGNLATHALNYTEAELRVALHRLSFADKSNVSSSLPNRLVLETLIMQIVPRKRRKAQ